MIKVESLEYQAGEKRILTQVDMEVGAGQFVGVIGRNGAGKSTLLNLMAGFLKPTSGVIEVNGKRLSQWDLGEVAKYRSVLSQEAVAHFQFCVFDILAMGRFPYSPLGRDDYGLLDECIEKFELAALLTRSYPTLSGGEKKRVHFVRSLLQIMPLSEERGLKWLLLDEPFAAVDLSLQRQLLDLLRSLNKEFGLGIILVSHDLNCVSQYCEKIFVLDAGELVNSGAASDVFTKQCLNLNFGLETEIFINSQGRPQIVF